MTFNWPYATFDGHGVDRLCERRRRAVAVAVADIGGFDRMRCNRQRRYVEGLAEEASVVEELVFPNAIPVRVTHRIKITAHWKKVRITIRTPRFELEQRRRPAQ